jgi:hypothetical protein
MRFEILCTLAAAGALAVGGAGCDTTEPAYTVIGGTIDQSTFPSRVQQITVLSDRGVVDQAKVDAATGAFHLSLVWGSTYIFLLSPDGQGTPLIVGTGSHGELEVEVEVVTGGLSADIGAVRFWGGAPSGSPATPAGKCAAGVIEGTSQPCSTGPATLACDGISASGDGQDDRGSAENTTPQQGYPAPGGQKGAPRYHHHHDDDDDDDGGGDGVLTASPNAPMAIPAMSLPPVLGCTDHLAD